MMLCVCSPLPRFCVVYEFCSVLQFCGLCFIKSSKGRKNKREYSATWIMSFCFYNYIYIANYKYTLQIQLHRAITIVDI